MNAYRDKTPTELLDEYIKELKKLRQRVKASNHGVNPFDDDFNSIITKLTELKNRLLEVWNEDT